MSGSRKGRTFRKITRKEGEELHYLAVWVRESDFEYLKARYDNVSDALRDMITADRRAYENNTFGKRST